MDRRWLAGGVTACLSWQATTSQMAKDVTIFLNWAAEPEHDLRKKMGMQWVAALTLMVIGSGYMKRFRWSLVKSRKLRFE